MSSPDSEVLLPSARTRLLVLAGAMGFTMYGLGFSVPLLKHDLNISRAVASLHNVGFAATITLTSVVIPRLIARYSPRDVMRAGWIIATLSILAFAAGKSLWITLPAMAAAGVGATLFNNTNAVTVGESAGMSTHVILRLSGITTLSGATSPIIIGFLIRNGISWRYTVAGCAAFLGLFALKLLPDMPNRAPTRAGSAGRHWDKTLLILVGFGFFATMMEVATGSWALDLLISRGFLLSSAVVLVAFYSYGIATSRLSFSMAEKLGADHMWWFSTVITAAGLILIITTTNETLAFLALIIAALGLGPIGALALAAAAATPKGGDAGVAANVIGAGPAIGVGSWLMGWVSDTSGFSVAYLIPLISLVIASIFFVSVRSQDKSKIT